MVDLLSSDKISKLLIDSDAKSASEGEGDVFGGNDTDDGSDFVFEESDYSDEEDDDSEPVNQKQRNIAVFPGKNGYLWSFEEPERRGCYTFKKFDCSSSWG